MLWILLIVAACFCLVLAVATLLRWQHQLGLWAALLESVPPQSNARLCCTVRSKAFLRLADAVNARLGASRGLAAQAEQAGRELQFTMAAVSHDIRTPLTGAGGYLQLLAETEDPARRTLYLQNAQRRLDDVESLLDELFLYTRLVNDAPLPACTVVALYPVLCEALAALYPKLKAAGILPEVAFTEENCRVVAQPEALGRICRNLTLNALQHGTGDLRITQTGGCLHFCNHVADPTAMQTEHLFDRFWRADAARPSTGNAGLGLSVVRQLAERMNGTVSAALDGNLLTITLQLPTA
ncbi:MAG: HAMP domain-containing sensor histidine kinase [Gemmiger sp.]|nr:HAMP domain-containing sensor histidine kinase [Gemmiger sp.]